MLTWRADYQRKHTRKHARDHTVGAPVTNKMGGRGPDNFLLNWGAGRHPIGLIKPVRVEVADPGLKRRQSDMFREIFLISAIFDL